MTDHDCSGAFCPACPRCALCGFRVEKMRCAHLWQVPDHNLLMRCTLTHDHRQWHAAGIGDDSVTWADAMSAGWITERPSEATP